MYTLFEVRREMVRVRVEVGDGQPLTLSVDRLSIRGVPQVRGALSFALNRGDAAAILQGFKARDGDYRTTIGITDIEWFLYRSSVKTDTPYSIEFGWGEATTGLAAAKIRLRLEEVRRLLKILENYFNLRLVTDVT